MNCSTSLACRLSCSLVPSLSAPQSNVKTGVERLEMRHGIIAVDKIYKYATILSVYIKAIHTKPLCKFAKQ